MTPMTQKEGQKPRNQVWVIVIFLIFGMGIGFWNPIAKFQKGQPETGSSADPPVIKGKSVSAKSSQIENGKLVYLSHCARCHGPDGDGRGPEVAGYTQDIPKPRNFHDAGWKWDARPETIEKVLKQGIPGSPMAAFGTTLGATDLKDLITFLTTLPPPEARIPNENGLRDYLTSLIKIDDWQWVNQPLGQDSKMTSTHLLESSNSTLTWKTLTKNNKDSLNIVQVWGITCAVCLEKMPEMPEMKLAMQKRGLGFFLLCADQPNVKMVKDFLKGQGIEIESLVDSNQSFQQATDLSLLPVTLLIDNHGRILARKTGMFPWKNHR